jgi:hypothetical protein
LQKLEGFTGISSSQLPEVATKVFVNRDQEARWEAYGKMKRKVGLLAEALAGQSDGPWGANPGRGRGNPKDGDKCPQDAPALRRN